MQQATIVSSEPLTEVERAELRTRAQRDGEIPTSRRIGVARNTLGRLIAGLTANRPTIIAARVYLAQHW